MQETQMSQVLDLSCVIPCQGTSTTVALAVFRGEEKNIFLWGSFSLANSFCRMQTHCPHPCSVPPHAWLLCSSHTHALLPLALLCSTHPTITHPHFGKAGVHPPSPSHHIPIPLTLAEEGLCLAAKISRSRLFQGKPHTELITAVMAEFKLSNDLNRGNRMPV